MQNKMYMTSQFMLSADNDPILKDERGGIMSEETKTDDVENEENEKDKKKNDVLDVTYEKSGRFTFRHLMGNAFGLVVSIIVLPILIFNISLIIKYCTNSDVVPDIKGYVPLVVRTTYMEPEISEGDLIILTSKDKGIKSGDIIAFYNNEVSNKSILIRRVVGVNQKDGVTTYTTENDLFKSESRTSISEEDIVGVHVKTIKGLGNVVLFMQSTAGLIICIVLPIILLLGYDVIKRRRYIRMVKRDTEDLLNELDDLKKQKEELMDIKSDGSHTD